MSQFKSIAVVIITVSLFVFFSCKEEVDTFAYYQIEGTVVDQTSKQPIPNILVIRQSTDYLLFPDSTFTDSIGKYDFEFTDYYKKTPTFKIQFEDIDLGFNLGIFEPKTVNVTFAAANWLELSPDSELKGEASIVSDVELKLANE